MRRSTVAKIAVAVVVVVVIVAVSNVTNSQMIKARSEARTETASSNGDAAQGSADESQSDSSDYLKIPAVSNFVQKAHLAYGNAVDGVTDNDVAKVSNAWSDIYSMKNELGEIENIPDNASEANELMLKSADEFYSAVDCLLASNAYANKGEYDTATAKIQESKGYSDAAMADYDEAMALLKHASSQRGMVANQ